MSERYVYINATGVKVPTNGEGGSSGTITASDLLRLQFGVTDAVWYAESGIIESPYIGAQRNGVYPSHVHVISGTGATAGLYQVAERIDDNRLKLIGAVGAADLTTGDIAASAVHFWPARLLGAHILSAHATLSKTLTLRDHIGTALPGGVRPIAAGQVGQFTLGFEDGPPISTGLSLDVSAADVTLNLHYAR